MGMGGMRAREEKSVSHQSSEGSGPAAVGRKKGGRGRSPGRADAPRADTTFKINKMPITMQ
eukprot:scaffold17390_cov104-Isochrysis_galbana.AAC.3